MESFLLNAIADDSDYDKCIIEKGRDYVDNADPEQRYLKHRRKARKAKYIVYFAIRASEEEYKERQEVLMDVPWEEYNSMYSDLNKLKDLGTGV